MANAIHVLAGATGAVLHTFAGPLQFEHPYGVCVTPTDAIIVADFGNDRLQEVPALGRGTATLLGVGLLQRPFLVALTAAEDALVVRQSGGTNRVVVLARDGRSLLRVLLTVDDVAPGHEGHVGLAVSRDGVVAAADWSQQKIVLCDVKQRTPSLAAGREL